MLATLKTSIDQQLLMAHLHEFARRVKLSGTTQEAESFAYLQARMDEYGYRTTLLSHDAFISLPGRARVEVDGAALQCITHSMSRSSGPDGVTGRLVDVGAGNAAAFEGRDLAGCILLVDGIATPDVAMRAARAGAVGELHISPNEHLYEMCVSPVWGSPSQHTRDALPTTVICSIAHDDGERLRATVGETTKVRLWAEVDTGWRKTPLLVAELAATGDGEPFVLLSGHHDTWHFGVMDNGAANATMLEAARVLASRRADWHRGLRVCFWSGHSHGRYSGSSWYVDEYWDELDRSCAAHVNVDSTGGVGASVLTDSWVVEELRPLAAKAVRAVSGQVHAGKRQARAADQSFFGVGIPSMFGSISHQPPSAVKMLTALGWWWHTPQDLIEHIDPDNLVRDTRIVLHTLWRLLTDPVLPLDFAGYADALDDELETLQAALSGRMEIGDARKAVAELRDLARAVVLAPDRENVNVALMLASRALVPINYTWGDRFRHDPALALPAWPVLQGLRDLAALPAGSPDEKFFAVHARQTRNRLVHALRQAAAALAGPAARRQPS